MVDQDFNLLDKESQHEIITDETRKFLNQDREAEKTNLFLLGNLFSTPSAAQIFSHDLRDLKHTFYNSEPVAIAKTKPLQPQTTTTEAPLPQLSAEDEDFLINHFAEGLDLEREFANILYPR